MEKHEVTLPKRKPSQELFKVQVVVTLARFLKREIREVALRDVLWPKSQGPANAYLAKECQAASVGREDQSLTARTGVGNGVEIPLPSRVRSAKVVWMTANIFDGIPSHMPEEMVHTLLQAADVRIERIVSHGNASAADFWYDQPQHEWVVVLKGAARLQFEDGIMEMRPGDFVNIPAHKKHRLEWTSMDKPTIWLAVH